MEGEAELRRADLASDPLEQFRRWFIEAEAAVDVPEAVALATATPEGAPSVRMVLLKGFDERGLVFYSHYTTRKGRELRRTRRPRSSSTGGPSAGRFGSRAPSSASPRRSRTPTSRRARADAQLGALASRQSDPLASRAELHERLAELERDLGGGPVPRPATWGGYRVVPAAWEFWQHRDSRLHDRFRYEGKPDGGWHLQRLFP